MSLDMITFEDIKNNKDINHYIDVCNNVLCAIGYTEHGMAHATITANSCSDILYKLGYDERTMELGKISAYMHDIGNILNRTDHAQSGALMAYNLLNSLNMPSIEISTVICAIGNHDEHEGRPVDAVSAALIIADKTDVRRSRVRNDNITAFDIHDRVNYSVTRTDLEISLETGIISLDLDIDTSISPVIDYFDIFITRMLLCKKAADYFKCQFQLIINGSRLA